jgi:4-amino-4-deoxy-L-arabinose transferase-like glycosyltransferase
MRWQIKSSHLFFVGLFAALTVPRMAQAGMFLDGITYAVLARNLAAGHGTFWNPLYTATVYPRFHEQPPLGFALEGLAFRVAGDHLAVERIFSLAMGLATLSLLIALWRSTFSDRDHDWLPILFWILPSTVTWGIVNNMLENTQAVLTTAAVFSFVRSCRDGSGGWPWAVSAGALTVAAALVKGPNGFFPLAAPVVAVLVFPQRAWTAVRSGAILVMTMATICGGLLVWPSAREALSNYWTQHLGAALAGDRGGSRVEAAFALARHLAGGIFLRMGAMAGLIWLAGRRLRSSAQTSEQSRWTAFFFLMALAASVPVLASTKIAGHYLIPSIPLFALGFAGLARPWAAALQERYIRTRAANALAPAGIAFLVAAAVLPLLPIAIEPRDVRWIAEFRAVGAALPRGSTIATCHAAGGEWGAQAYMQRLFRVSLDIESDRYPYFLQFKDRECAAPARCQPAIGTERLTLLACNPE